MRILLGTAQWGWTVDRPAAFALLDAWLQAGETEIDAATNYPIDKNPDHFRLSEQILLEYLRAHGLQQLAVTMKIGSLNNLRTPDVNLAPSFLRMMTEEYLRLFGSNLRGMMVHWDNRADERNIRQTLEALNAISQEFGLQPGLSGIKHPEVYAEANKDYGLTFDMQVKHNVFQSDYTRYAPLHQAGHRFLAYGINGGGIRLHADYREDSTYLARGGDPDSVAARLAFLRARLPDWNIAFVRPPIQTMNHLGLIHAVLHPGIDGMVLGASAPAQLAQTLAFIRNIEAFDYSDVFKGLKA